jgi:RNA polymerase sigma-70 factor (ECF subfamily)
MNSKQDAQLIQAAQRGDREALGQLLQHHQQRIFNICLRMVSHRDDAIEIAQDVMVKVIEHIADFKGQAALTTWITRIAMNQSISHLRKRKLRQTTSLDTSVTDPGDQLSPLREQLKDSREPTPLKSVQNREMLMHLQEALSQIEDDFRVVLVLRDFQQMDYQQVAEVLDVPVGTVKSRLFRGRLALRKVMQERYPQIAHQMEQ